MVTKTKVKVKCSRCGRMKTIQYDDLECPRCHGDHIVSHSSVTTVKNGVRERFICRDCGHTFYDKKDGGK